MDSAQVISLVSDIGLVLFTGGLVFFTICLWRSTKRYADATEELVVATNSSSEAAKQVADSTQRSVEATENLVRATELSSEAAKQVADSTQRSAAATEKLLEAEKISFIGRMYECIHHAHVGRRDQINRELGDDTVESVKKVCVRVTEELLNDMLKEYSRDDEEHSP